MPPHSPYLLGLCSLGWLVACAPDAPPREGERDTSTEAAPVVERLRPRALDQLRVSWPDRSTVDAAVVASLSEDARVRVARSTVPVMLPADLDLTRAARVVDKPQFTTAAFSDRETGKGVSVFVSATKVAHRYGHIRPAERASQVRGGKPAWVLENESIWSVSWDEHGVSYVLEVECARPSEDPRCASPDFALSLVESLRFVGGSFAGEEGSR